MAACHLACPIPRGRPVREWIPEPITENNALRNLAGRPAALTSPRVANDGWRIPNVWALSQETHCAFLAVRLLPYGDVVGRFGNNIFSNIIVAFSNQGTQVWTNLTTDPSECQSSLFTLFRLTGS